MTCDSVRDDDYTSELYFFEVTAKIFLEEQSYRSR
jgi:hypothetical protein